MGASSHKEIRVKKSIAILAIAPILFSAIASLRVNSASADQVNTSITTDVQKSLEHPLSSDFINKFDQSIKLLGNKFIIDTNKLPKDIASEELSKLKALISQKNEIISDSENLKNGTRIEQNNNSVTIISNSGNSGLLRFREGSNYVHVYWWGLRIGLSKSTVNGIGTGVAIGGVWIPEPTVSKILASLGILAAASPGGIVFNSTPPIAVFWGAEFQ